MGELPEALQLEPLDAPEWVPLEVVFWAQVMLASIKDDYPRTDPTIRRLVNEPRMEAVWSELRKQHPGDTLGRFFSGVVSLLWTALPVVSSRYLETLREPLRIRAHSMRVMVAELRAHGVNEEHAISSAIYLAEKWEELATRYPVADNHPSLAGLVVDRPGDARTRGYLIALVRLSRDTFGSPHYSTMAKIASVALGLEITERRVRYAARR
jgi:hypothetical protein